MFTIIGADQKRYGPVSEDEIRQWIRDGRADARTLALREGTTDWKPLATFPEFAADFPSAPMSAAQPPPLPGQGPTATPEELLSQDYDLDIFGCISRAWNLASNNAGPVIGITLLVLLGLGVVGQIVGLISYPVTNISQQLNPSTPPSVDNIINQMTEQLKTEFTPLGISLMFLSSLIIGPFQGIFMGGLYRYYLKLIRGQKAEIGDAFSGFTQSFSTLAMAGFMLNLLLWIGFAFLVIPAIYFAVALLFMVPLVADKGMAWSEAMKLSMKMVNKHWFMVLGLLLVASLVKIAGLVVCCIGILFTIPVCWIALMYAYEDIFCRKAR